MITSSLAKKILEESKMWVILMLDVGIEMDGCRVEEKTKMECYISKVPSNQQCKALDR